MFESKFLGFNDVGLEVWAVAAVTLILLVLALVAASAEKFFRGLSRFAYDEREATMEMTPTARRRFYELYAAKKPRDPAVAWFLAVGTGPIGVNLYRGKLGPFLIAVLSLNGLGAWWFESLFTAPQLVLIENRGLMQWTLEMMAEESRRAQQTDTRPAA